MDLYMMISKIKQKFDFLKGTAVCGLKFLYEANTVPEKIFWSIIDLIAFSWLIYLVCKQIEIFGMNPIMSNRKWVDLSDIDYPAITFCHQGNTRFEVAERLLEAADEKSSKSREIRSIFLKLFVRYILQNSYDYDTWQFTYFLYAKDISANYVKNCKPSKAANTCQGCFQLEFVSRIINHMACYNSSALIGGLFFSKSFTRFALESECCNFKQ